MTPAPKSQNLHPVAVCVLPAAPVGKGRGTSHAHYIHEILQHAGLCYSTVEFDELAARLPAIRLLVTIGEYDFESDFKEQLQNWLENGGAWLSLTGVCGLEEIFGVERCAPEYSGAAGWGSPYVLLGEGYLALNESAHPALSHLQIPLHFYNGIAVRARRADATRVLSGVLDAHGRSTPRVGVAEREVGRGRALLIAPDAVGAVVHIQQGRAVTRDGVPAPDGSGPIADEVLKSDDGQVLDWYFDREEVEGAPGLKIFRQPVADQWRELILRAIFHLAQKQSIAVPLLWLYPRNLPALAHMSHDSDGNDPALARRLLEVVAKAEINTTWCVIPPGYPPEIIAEIRAAGHELAMHYDALATECPWSEEEFERQWKLLCGQFGNAPTTNKNHYTRWEGDTEFFDWCLRRGLTFEQSKGASKIGEAGFNFGACHPYFPVAPDGEVLPIYELPTHTQDLEVFAPPAIVPPLLEAVLRHHGVLHLLFHPAHFGKPEVAEALLNAVRLAKERGLEWWTAERINLWLRARRDADWLARENSGGCVLRVATALPQATLLFLNASTVRLDGREVPLQCTRRWGFDFQTATLDLTPGEYSVEW